MRFDDLIKPPAKKQKPLTYTESLESKLKAQMLVKSNPKLSTEESDQGSKNEST